MLKKEIYQLITRCQTLNKTNIISSYMELRIYWREHNLGQGPGTDKNQQTEIIKSHDRCHKIKQIQ